MNIDIFKTLTYYYLERQIDFISKTNSKKHFYISSIDDFLMIPDDVDTLVFDNIFNKPILQGDIPENIIYIIFGWCFNQKISPNVLPIGLKYIVFGLSYNQPLDKNVIPNTVEQLIFEGDFNQPLKKNDIPNSVKYLLFGTSFNQPLYEGILPNSIVYLDLGEIYNIPLKKGVIPYGVNRLVLSYYYEHKLFTDNILPETIHYITLSNSDYIINETIPKHIFEITKSNKCSLTIPISNINIYDCDDFDGLYNVNNNNYYLTIYKKIDMDCFIDNYKTISFFQELIIKILEPNRIKRFSKKYNIEFKNIIDMYT